VYVLDQVLTVLDQVLTVLDQVLTRWGHSHVYPHKAQWRSIMPSPEQLCAL